MRRKKFKLSGMPATTRIAAGIDVHKYKLHVLVLGFINGIEQTLGEQVFKNDENGRKELCNYLARYYPREIVMEKTGVLSNPLLKALSKFHGWKDRVPGIKVVHPDTLKRFPGEVHLDSRSAYKLALFGNSGLLKSIYIPTKAGQQLRQLTREKESLTMQSTALVNMIKDYLAGLGYTMEKLNIAAAWGLAFLKLLLMDGIDGNIEKIYELVEKNHVKLHSSSKQAILDRKQAFMGYAHLTITRFDARFLGRKLTMLAMIEAEKDANARHVEDHVTQHPLLKAQVQRIDQVPGIGTAGAAVIVAEVDDPFRFATCKKFQLYAGRAIAPDSSGEYEGKPRMSKRCNHHLRRVFKQAGSTACTRVKWDSDIRRYSLRQLGKHPRTPGIAAANTSAKIIRIVYKIMHDGITYDPLHETRRKNTNVPPFQDDDDASWKPKLKEARKRASRFRNFTRRTVAELPDGELKDLFNRVLEAFKEIPH